MLGEPVRVRELDVPLDADPVGPVEVRYGSLADSITDEAESGLLFLLSNEQTVGRVTFEGLDSLRAARGEYVPYEAAKPSSGWVRTITGSAWLAERHEYEWSRYRTSLTENYQHYLFLFHDDFVEAIARGIWLDVVSRHQPWLLGADHPTRLLDTVAAEAGGTIEGVQWRRRRNPQPLDALLSAARLCSQDLLRWTCELDGRESDLMTLRVRATDQAVRYSLSRPWVGSTDEWNQPPPQDQLTAALERRCTGIAMRRRQMGLA